MVVGILDHELGTRDIRKLGGLMSFMPISFTLTLIGAFSMAGLPPFSGFLSKEMFFTGVFRRPKGILAAGQRLSRLSPGSPASSPLYIV